MLRVDNSNAVDEVQFETGIEDLVCLWLIHGELRRLRGGDSR